MAKLTQLQFQRRRDAHLERTAVDIVCPHMVQAISIIGGLLNLHLRPDERLAHFAGRIMTELVEDADSDPGAGAGEE